MIRLERRLVSGRTVQIRLTDRGDGDFAVAAHGVDDRRRDLVDAPWTWLQQVHGSDVVLVETPAQYQGDQADGAATATGGAVLGVCTADCAPVVLLGDDAVAVVHAGWRGAVGGVVQAGVERLRELGGGPVSALIGPCIRPASYEFGPTDLDAVADRCGDEVRGLTAEGRPALDLVAVVRAACREQVESVTDLGHDTADSRWFSNRVRSEPGRQVTAAWIEP
ncbi:MAG: polyphenol oxidase family protein [Acidimicrobiales bacterium]